MQSVCICACHQLPSLREWLLCGFCVPASPTWPPSGSSQPPSLLFSNPLAPAKDFQKAVALASPWKEAKHQRKRVGPATPVSGEPQPGELQGSGAQALT